MATTGCSYKYCPCCCASPRTATLIFGILGLVAAFLNGLSFLVFCFMGDPLKMSVETKHVLMVICTNFNEDSYCSKIIEQNDNFLIGIKVYVAFNYAVTFLYLATCSLLLVAIRDEKKELLLPYIWCNVCLIFS